MGQGSYRGTAEGLQGGGEPGGAITLKAKGSQASGRKDGTSRLGAALDRPRDHPCLQHRALGPISVVLCSGGGESLAGTPLRKNRGQSRDSSFKSLPEKEQREKVGVAGRWESEEVWWCFYPWWER